jgi:uncharacterized protein YjbI with pentapeptide repeats
MTDFHEQDLSGARFERVLLQGAEFRQVRLNDARLRSVDLSGVHVRDAMLSRTRFTGVELADVEISGDLENVVVNGVDIAPLVEAELNRRMPDRAKMRPVDSDGFREAWSILERLWEDTVERARTFPEESLHVSVGEEWSFIQTLRHLSFASAAWVGGLVLRDPSPWHPLDLPWDEAPGWEGVPWDREARPSLEEVLAVRGERQAMVRGVMDTLTDDRLKTELTSTEPGWPDVGSASLEHALRVVLNEEWEHRQFAERDLSAIETGGAPRG